MADAVSEYLSKLGRKGAEVTNRKLSPAQRKKNARKAITARWAKRKKEKL